MNEAAQEANEVAEEFESSVGESNGYGEDQPGQSVAEATETENEEAPTTADSDSAPEQSGDSDEPEWFKKRINKMTAEKHEERRKAERLEAELNELKANQQAEPTQSKEPQPEDFEDDYDGKEYQKALIKHQVEQERAALDNQRREELEKQRAEKTVTEFNIRLTDFKEAAPDFEDVVKDVPQLPTQTLGAVMSMENGPQVAYYLGKNLEVAYEIAGADPIAAALKLGEIQATLKAAKTQPKKPSAAPDPVERIGSGSPAAKDISDMSMEEIYNNS